MKKVYLCHPEANRKPPEELINFTHNINVIDTIPASSCTELYVDGTYFDIAKLKDIIQKVRLKGKITITGPELFEIARNVVHGFMSEQDVRMMLGPGEQLYSCLEITMLLQQLKLKIIHKRINHNRFAITAERV